MNEEVNTFQELEASSEKPVETATPVGTGNLTKNDTAPSNSGGEIDISDFSDTAIGDKVKYNRPALDGTEDVVDKFQVFSVNTNEEPVLSQAGNSKYWKVEIQMHYASKNEDEMQNREYISGARAFQQKDGSASDISFWYPGAETQAAYLWELVAKVSGKECKDMSPREFIAFLNSKPKVKIVGMKYKNFGAQAGVAATVTKNMPGEFVKA